MCATHAGHFDGEGPVSNIPVSYGMAAAGMDGRVGEHPVPQQAGGVHRRLPRLRLPGVCCRCKGGHNTEHSKQLCLRIGRLV